VRDRIAFVTHNHGDYLPMLYVVDLQSATLSRVSSPDPDRFPSDFGLRSTSPVAWSLNGEHIAFVAYDSAGRAALFVSEVASGTVTRLTEGSEPVTSVGWEMAENEQGDTVQRIVYALVRAGETRLYTVEPNGANNQRWGEP
jgi:Tol biopolymer transport system component